MYMVLERLSTGHHTSDLLLHTVLYCAVLYRTACLERLSTGHHTSGLFLQTSTSSPVTQTKLQGKQIPARSAVVIIEMKHIGQGIWITLCVKIYISTSPLPLHPRFCIKYSVIFCWLYLLATTTTTIIELIVTVSHLSLY